MVALRNTAKRVFFLLLVLFSFVWLSGCIVSDKPIIEADKVDLLDFGDRFAVFFGEERETFNRTGDTAVYASEKYDTVTAMTLEEKGKIYLISQVRSKEDGRFYFFVGQKRGVDGEYAFIDSSDSLDSGHNFHERYIKRTDDHWILDTFYRIGHFPKVFNNPGDDRRFRIVTLDTRVGRETYAQLAAAQATSGDYDQEKVEKLSKMELFEAAIAQGGEKFIRSICTTASLGYAFQSAGVDLFNRGKLVDVYYRNGSCYITHIFNVKIELFLGVNPQSFQCSRELCTFRMGLGCDTNGNIHMLCGNISNELTHFATAQKSGARYQLISVEELDR